MVPVEELRLARERIQRFLRLGGVPLKGNHDLQAEVRSGIAEHRGAVFTFRCPLCGRVERNNQDMEPLCTGPSWTDDHPGEPMARVPT